MDGLPNALVGGGIVDGASVGALLYVGGGIVEGASVGALLYVLDGGGRFVGAVDDVRLFGGCESGGRDVSQPGVSTVHVQSHWGVGFFGAAGA